MNNLTDTPWRTFDWKKVPNVTGITITDKNTWKSMKDSIIQFQTDRLADIMKETMKSLNQREEFYDKEVTITSSVSFGPIRLTVSMKDVINEQE